MKLLSAATIRRCLIADPGMLIISSDFDQIEWRVIAALSGEQSMIDAAKRGESIHKLAAVRLFGEDYTPDQYKRTKNINFTWAFGGGPGKMARQYGIPYAEAAKLVKDYGEAFPALVAFKRREQEAVLRSALSSNEYRTYKALLGRMFHFRGDTNEGRMQRAVIASEMDRMCRGRIGYITTAFGRRLPVDALKPYTVVNYKVQSTAADIMKNQLLRVMADPELEPTVLLPIHDEILGQAPKAEAEYFAQRYSEVMSTEFMGVPITAGGKVYGKSWGHGYR